MLTANHLLQMGAAIDRVPVELWRDILEYALSSPLLPHRDNSILEARTVLLQGCEADGVHLAHQRRIVACRLVCRAWDEFAQGIERRCLTNHCGSLRFTACLQYPWVLQEGPLRGDGTFIDCAAACSRLEMIKYATRTHPHCRNKGCYLRRRRPVNITRDGGLSAKSESVALKVLISRERSDFRSVLDRSPQLRAFSVSFVRNPYWLQEVIRHPALQRLTHLECWLYLEQFLGLFSAVSLRSLVYLCINTQYGHSGPASWTAMDVDGVTLPNLKHLYISISISPEAVVDISAFIRSSSARLTSLVCDGGSHWYRAPDWSRACGFTTDFWDAIPHVVNLGIDPQILFINDRAQGITETISPPSTSDALTQGLHLILPHSPDIHSHQTDTATQLREMRYLIEHWNVYKVTLSVAKWENLEAHVRDFRAGNCRANLGCLPCSSWFFELMAEYGITVLDADGEGIRQGNGRRHVETVASLGFDNVGVDSSTWKK